jgi:GTP-binding protein HflX
LFFGNKQENFEELRERLYEVILKYTLPFPYNKFLYPDYKDAVERRDEGRARRGNTRE